MVCLSKKLLGLILYLILISLLSSTVFASVYDERHIELLAVQTLEDGSTTGKSADLYLQVRDGSGKVYLDTTPLTKVDTQATTRYAKDMACEYFDLNCDKYDFFFTIQSDTSIVGGPSAGAATAALTAIAVMDLDHEESVAVTGTINSGGTIGPVGGVKSKIEAASEQGLSKVLVPLGALSEPINEDLSDRDDWYRYYTDFPSQRTSSPRYLLDDYANYVLGIKSIEIVDLSELIFELTGENFSYGQEELVVDETYVEIMGRLDQILCNRFDELNAQLITYGKLTDEISFNLEEYQNDSLDAREMDNSYSSASACFRGNIYLQYQILEEMNLSISEVNDLVEINLNEVFRFKEELDEMPLITISDLQTKMIVLERLREAEEYLNLAKGENSTYALAYGKERIFSAETWSEFFEMDGKKLDLSSNSLQQACYLKILEAQERYQYLQFFFEYFDLSVIEDKIVEAQVALGEGDYELCILQAAQAKSQASSVISGVGLGSNVPQDYLEAKKDATLRNLVKNTGEGKFPILGYSFFMFAENDEEDNPYSALLNYEYALEISELNIYFPEVDNGGFLSDINLNYDSTTFFSGFFQGLLIGILLTLLFVHFKKLKRK